jgi:hypothetical protein
VRSGVHAWQVHGANFCFIMSRNGDAIDVRCGKRREVLREEEDFFGHGVLRDRLRPQVLRVFAHIEQHQAAILADHVTGLGTSPASPHMRACCAI